MTERGNRSLRFALGPVRSFVAQSRRTRDLWSGSFLVSYLSACAVDAFEDAGARVVLPDVTDDPLVAAVRAVRRGETVARPPEIGSVPNQLTVEADEPLAAAHAAQQRVVDAWRRITEAVWEVISPAASHGRDPRVIWERQLGSFWQIHWAVGGAGTLARRKSWRGQYREPEPGDKCTLMAGWQELSGHHRSTERRKQDAFWLKLRHTLGGFDLNESERLSALALVKRLFPSVAQEAIGWNLDTVHWPSTPYLAARPWLEDVLTHGGSELRDEAELYAMWVDEEASKAQAREQGANRIRTGSPDVRKLGFLVLGGSYLFKEDLGLPDRTPLTDEAADRDEAAELLDGVYWKAAAAGRRSRPSPFYALLQLDGDRLGKLFEGSRDRSAASEALARFGREAQDLVASRGGLTVYAGGDDLVAFLSLPSAVTTAVELAALYEEKLAAVIDENARATISASLVFAHCRAPLRSVVAEGHRMLEDDAKDGNGRGSIAVAVWKGSGVTARCVTTWEQLVPDWPPAVGADLEAVSHRIGAVTSSLRDDEVSASFLYGQREVLTRLAGVEPWHPGLIVELAAGVEAEVLVRAELARARDKDPDAVKDVALALTKLMEPGHRGDDGLSIVLPGRLAFDPLLVARFLSVESPGETP